MFLTKANKGKKIKKGIFSVSSYFFLCFELLSGLRFKECINYIMAYFGYS